MVKIPTVEYKTQEYKELTLDEFIVWFVLNAYDFPHAVVGKEDLWNYCDEHGIKYAKRETKPMLMEKILEPLTEDEKIELCNTLRIGVSIWNYLAAGMPEKEYNKQRRKRNLKIVSGCGNDYHTRYNYEVRQFLDYMQSREKDQVSAE